MRVEFNTPELAVEPRMLVQYEHVLAMALRPGWVEVGQRRWEMEKTNFGAGELVVCPRKKVWLGAHSVERLILTISDSALRAANDGISGDVELRGGHKLADARLGFSDSTNTRRDPGVLHDRRQIWILDGLARGESSYRPKHRVGR